MENQEKQAFLDEFLLLNGISPEYFLFDEKKGIILDKYDYFWEEIENGYVCENFYISKAHLRKLQKEFLEKIKNN